MKAFGFLSRCRRLFLGPWLIVWYDPISWMIIIPVEKKSKWQAVLRTSFTLKALNVGRCVALLLSHCLIFPLSYCCSRVQLMYSFSSCVHALRVLAEQKSWIFHVKIRPPNLQFSGPSHEPLDCCAPPHACSIWAALLELCTAQTCILNRENTNRTWQFLIG